MTVKKLALAALGATFLAGAMAPASFAAPGAPGRGPGGHAPHAGIMREIMFVRLLKDADTNKDAKISKEEFRDYETKLFDAADANKDGILTPGELRKFHEARMEEWREKRKADRAEAADDDQDEMAQAPDAPPPGPDAKPGPDGKDGSGPRHEARDRGERGEGRNWHYAGMRYGMMNAGIFRFADTDENGQISKEEASAAANKLFGRLDRTKDGVISIDDMPDRPL
ncbi:hypothetical protein ACFSE1_04865 [Rhizobium helianthi]|uniref:EF-hand domain-containing protein n=1 Tax=Rhizobium helianthi TaxID=1132695 RepID=A0ABW4M026_9HYPH